MRGNVLCLKLVFIITFFLTSACTEDLQLKFKKVIVEYNQAVITAYQSGTAKGLLDIAAEKESNKVQVLIDVKSSNGLVLESELQNIEILSVTAVTPTDYSVRTKERWKYFDRPLTVGASAGQVFIADMQLEYAIQKNNNKWKVLKVKAEKTEYLEQKPSRKE
jgi:hypothetical protein